ncbi:ROK family transcriptional regulator [Streptomyces sp. NPDC005969]|uniref:ROK family transcriptional regulator n=1 Tax=Streptomyces sp. NPDC005969 TaxID=3156722 RepID=UPI0033F6BE7E
MTPTPARRNRAAYDDLVLAELRRSGALSRAELSRRTGLPKTTLFSIVTGLLEAGVLVEQAADDTAGRGVGRPATRVVLNPSAGLYVGLDIGRSRMHLVIVNTSHEVVASGMCALPSAVRADVVAPAAAELLRRAVGEAAVDPSTLVAVGAGLTGIVGVEWKPKETEELRARIAEEFGVPVVLGNNSRAAALAEATWGAGRSAEDLVYVRWSTGIGGGLVVGGRAVAGAHGCAGEIGHVSVEPDGKPCHCGGRGCLEGVAGGAALLEQCARHGLVLADLDALVATVRNLSPAAGRVVSSAADLLGRVLAGTVAQLNPSRIVVGGELAQLGSLVLDPIREALDRFALPRAARRVDVVQADLGANAAALGAVALLLREEPART